MSLNPEQLQAMKHNHGPLLILAGAGSGKTTVLVHRTERLIAEQICKPEEICVLTFTNKAAKELKHRVTQRLGSKAVGLWAGTFHSFGLRVLKENHKLLNLHQHFGVIDQSDSQAVIKELLRDLKVAGKDKFDVDHLLELVNQIRVHGKYPDQAFDEYHELAEVLAPKYEKKLVLLGVVDFEGLLLKPIQLFKSNPEVLSKYQNKFKQVMVDEFQDTNATQMKLIDLLVKNHRNITVVGDDDQSIYGWRGAEVKNILDFPKLYKPCEVVRLERNYRSSSAVLDVANNLITKNKHRHNKVLRAEGKFKAESNIPELFVFEDENEESEFIAREISRLKKDGVSENEIAVLYRSNSQGGFLESILKQNHINYTVSGGTGFFDRKEIKDILAYLRLALSPNDVALRRVINTPARGIGDTTVEKINEQAKEQKISFTKAAQAFQHPGLERLFHFTRTLAEQLYEGPHVSENFLKVFRELGYKDYLLTISKDAAAAEKRWSLIEVFSRVFEKFVQKGGANLTTLSEFLESMELRDEEGDENKAHVSLMTLHASKGLEFKHVYIIGVEEDLLPHKNLGSNIDEERRLFYVGLTRAEKHLVLSRCKLREKYGQKKPVSPSRFLLEIPKSLIREYANGFRPVTATERADLLSGFLAGLDSKIDKQPKQKR